jgi:hypothetical protein
VASDLRMDLDGIDFAGLSRDEIVAALIDAAMIGGSAEFAGPPDEERDERGRWTAGGIAAAYHGAVKLTDEEHARALAAADKATKEELQDALKQMGFRHGPGDSRDKLAEMVKRFISDRRGSYQKHTSSLGKGHPLAGFGGGAEFAKGDDDSAGGRWVTIGASGEGDDAHGGTPVFIGADGTIQKGPAHMVGKKPDQLGKGAKADEGEMVARTEKRERFDVDNGHRYAEYRVRHVPQAEREKMHYDRAVNLPFGHQHVLERRLVKTGEGGSVGGWEFYHSGASKKEAIKAHMGDSDYAQAESLHPLHKEAVEEKQAGRRLMQEAEQAKREAQGAAERLQDFERHATGLYNKAFEKVKGDPAKEKQVRERYQAKYKADHERLKAERDAAEEKRKKAEEAFNKHVGKKGAVRFTADQPPSRGRLVQPLAADFYSPDQLRDHRGRWTDGGGGAAEERTHADRAARSAEGRRSLREHTQWQASDHAKQFRARTGPVTAAEAGALAARLSKLSVKELHALKREHGLKASAPVKAELVRKLGERFAAHRAATKAAVMPAAAQVTKPTGHATGEYKVEPYLKQFASVHTDAKGKQTIFLHDTREAAAAHAVRGHATDEAYRNAGPHTPLTTEGGAPAGAVAEVEAAAKQRLGSKFGGMAKVRYGPGRWQYEVRRIKDGYHGREKVLDRTYKIGESPKAAPAPMPSAARVTAPASMSPRLGRPGGGDKSHEQTPPRPLPASVPPKNAEHSMTASQLRAAVVAHHAGKPLSPTTHSLLNHVATAESTLSRGAHPNGWKLTEAEKERLTRALSESKAKLGAMLRGGRAAFTEDDLAVFHLPGRLVAPFAFDPDQPRDDDGKWSAGGSSRVRHAELRDKPVLTDQEQKEFDRLAEDMDRHEMEQQIAKNAKTTARRLAAARDGVPHVKGAEAFRATVGGKTYWVHLRTVYHKRSYSFDGGDSWSGSMEQALENAKSAGGRTYPVSEGGPAPPATPAAAPASPSVPAAKAAPPPTPPPAVAPKAARSGKKLLPANAISDFRPGVDRVERRGDKTFVVDGQGQYAPREVQSDRMTPEVEASMRKLTPAQREMAIRQTATTPYLSEEGRKERLRFLRSLDAGFSADGRGRLVEAR